MSDVSSSSRQSNEGVGILKSLWRRNEAGKWIVHDLQGLDLEPREGFEHHYFKIKPAIALLTARPGPVFDNVFATFGTTEFLLRQSVVPVVAWNQGDKIMRCIGTGFFISASGLLLTAAHVIRDPVDEKYAATTWVEKNTHRIEGTLNFGILLPANPATKNAPFHVPQQMREARWFMCPFEWTQHWGREVDSPLLVRDPDFRLDLDIAVCKVAEQPLIGPFQPLNVGLHKLEVGDRATAIGYAEMQDIPLGGGDFPEPELLVSTGSVMAIYPDNIVERQNTTPGPNFEFDAKIPGKMSGAPILVGGGILTKGVVSRSWQGENFATGCLVAPIMRLPLASGKSLAQLQQEGSEGIAQISGAGL